MNLNLAAGPVVRAVNPDVTLEVLVSAGPAATAADGGRAPSYLPMLRVPGNVQNLTFRDLAQVEGLNLQGTRRAIYLNGKADGIVRADNKGGDLVRMPDGTVWLVAMVLEAWQGWTKVAATLQNDASAFDERG
jgi:hypothetical protein